MKNSQISLTQFTETSRKGSIMVLSIGLMIILFAFTAFAVDIGYITLTRAQLQRSADAAALAANLELYDGWGVGATKTPAEVATAARAAAVAVAAENNAGGLDSTYLDSNLDIRFGQRQWDEVNEEWNTSWNTSPYNVVEVITRRDNFGSQNGDVPIDLWFAPVIGRENATLSVRSTAALVPAVKVRKIPSQNVDVLPYALDVGTWDAMLNGTGQDNYTYNDQTGQVTNGPDGILEVDLFPYGNQNLPPGNRGTVDFGHAGNSTADIRRQILYGLNDDDLSYFGGELDFEAVPMQINGDTGISAGVKGQLEQIKGQPRMIPLFTTVSGNGNNAMYTVVKFVPIRIVYVKLTGKPSGKKVYIQPAPFYDATTVGGDTVITEDSILTGASIVQ
ncbi:MAG: Tad domain-containing protein [Planctomicrobium sp.]|jgi:hypothetical protein|nr:Tad domain-containing protein [Planctomicrobium sp.]